MFGVFYNAVAYILLSPIDFKKLSVLAQTISFLYSCAYFKNVFVTIFTAVWNIKVFVIPWYTRPVLRKYS